MPDKVTLTTEEMQSLKDFQNHFRIITSQYGEAYFQHKMLTAELGNMDKQMENLEVKRIEFMQTLQTKYGVGTININTGEFMPEQVSPSNQNA